MSRSQVHGAGAALEVLVCFDGAVLAALELGPGETLRVGPGTEFPVEEVPPGLVVAGLDLGGPFVQFHGGALGEVRRGERAEDLAALIAAGRCPLVDEGVRRHDLDGGAHAILDLGPLTLHAKAARPAPRVPRTIRVDWGAQRFIGAAAAGAALLMLFAFLIPPDPAMAASDNLRVGDEILHTHFVPKAPDEPKPLGASPEKKKQDHTSRMRGVEGEAGDRRSTARGRLRIKGTADHATIAGGTDVAGLARTSGLNAILGDVKGGVLGQVFDPNQTALGDAAEAFKGRLDGLEDGPGHGVDGAGILGTGPGGGCVGDLCTATVAFGDGFCPGGRCGGGPGSPWGARGPKSPTTPRHVSHGPVVEKGTATVTCAPGAPLCLDKETIRRVIHAHMNQIRFCYERELTRAPELEGKVAVSFLIARDGRVMSSVPKDSTLADPVVPGCVAEAVHRLQFPMPPGAPPAQVSYPFLFRHAGNE